MKGERKRPRRKARSQIIRVREGMIISASPKRGEERFFSLLFYLYFSLSFCLPLGIFVWDQWRDESNMICFYRGAEMQ